MQTLFSSVQFSSVQLFKTSLGQAFKHLEAPWRSLEAHWRVSYPTGNQAKSNHSYRQPVCIHRFSYNLEGHTCNYKPGFSSSFICTFIQLQIIRNSLGIQWNPFGISGFQMFQESLQFIWICCDSTSAMAVFHCRMQFGPKLLIDTWICIIFWFCDLFAGGKWTFLRKWPY